MGTIYFVGCFDCNIYRDLDKFYTSNLYPVETRQQALDFSEQIKEDSFKAGLLVSFMGKHKDHKCTLFTEHEETTWMHFDPDDTRRNYENVFWELTEKEK